MLMLILVLSKLVKTKTNSKYLKGFFDKGLRLIALIIPQMNGYVKTSKVKEGDKDKTIN